MQKDCFHVLDGDVALELLDKRCVIDLVAVVVSSGVFLGAEGAVLPAKPTETDFGREELTNR